MSFTEKLQHWASENPRVMPWKGEKDPYRIWLSEIILQQTRVEQGLPYYERFIVKYPTVQDLANASEDELMKMWEGLGYYSRARNLQAAAKFIVGECLGVFPRNYNDLLKLKGVGDYTASAIASFAYNLPHPVLDGNVYRVLARIYGIDTPINAPSAKKEFSALAERLLDKSNPGLHNQAIMDFGAMCCTPQKPDCKNCPFQENCFAFRNDTIDLLPVKIAANPKSVEFYLFVVLKTKSGKIFIEKRTEKGIWHNLWQFPLVEFEVLCTSIEALEKEKNWKIFIKNYRLIAKPLYLYGSFKHLLTHKEIHASFLEMEVESVVAPLGWIEVSGRDLEQYAFPKLVHYYLKNYNQI